MSKAKKVVKEVVKATPKPKYPAILDEIEIGIEFGVTHHDNPENRGLLRGQEVMLEKVKSVLSK